MNRMAMKRGSVPATLLGAMSWLVLGGVATAQVELQGEEVEYGETETIVVDDVAVRVAVEEPVVDYRAHLLFELNGAWGGQIGDTDYLPSGAPDNYEHPLVQGPGAGGSIGLLLLPNVAVVGSYDYTWATTVTGDVPGVIDDVRGTIDYHAFGLGLRLIEPIGFGRIRAELGGDVLLPFETRLVVEHGAALGQVGITGTGEAVSTYSVGIGAHALIGYELPIGDHFYLSPTLRIRVFQSENAGETTTYRNFVTDYTASPPTAVDAEVRYGDGAARPETHAVADARALLSLGVRI